MSGFKKSVLGLSALSPADKVIKTQNIKDSMQSSGNFPASNMPITYPAIQTLITNLHNAIVAASNGLPTDTAYMHEQEHLVQSAYNFIKAHIEFVANANASNVDSIITSAGLQVATLGGQSGVTELTVDALGNGLLQVRVPRQTGEKAFVFESSADGHTWVEFACNSLTKVTLPNQVLGSTVNIRYAAISKTGKGAYSQAISVIVV